MSIPRSLTAYVPLIFILAAGSADAADQARRPAPSRSEKIARAKWQPVRSTANHGTAKPTAVRQAAALRPMQDAEQIPTPSPLPSVIEGEVFEGEVIEGELIYEDGGIMSESFYDSSYALTAPCDAMICGGGGCDGCGGIGCDAALHCDAPGRGAGCSDSGWRPCVTLCLPNDGWFSAEYLLWQQREMFLPPLVTRGALRTTNPNLASGADIVYGNGDYMEESFSGLRLNFGLWLDRCHEWSIAGEYFGWDEMTEGASFGSNGINSIGRPFTNLSESGAPQRAQAIDFQGVNAQNQTVNITGSVDVQLRSSLQGGGFQFRRFLVANDGCGDTIFLNAPAAYRSRIDLGIGYRYTELDEGLLITEDLTSTQPTQSTFDVFDAFDTRTQFNGLDLGMYYTRQRGCWTLDLTGRFALGTNHQTVMIDGGTVVNNGAQQTGGLLALSSNIGSYDRDRLSVLPELGGKIGYQITPALRATVGYTFVYWSNVVRPGDQIDTRLNSTLIPRSGAAATSTQSPEFRFNETDYWAQGVSFGGEFRW